MEQYTTPMDAARRGIVTKELEDVYKRQLLEHVAGLIAEKGYIVENIDATIIAQKPKMLSLIHI